MVILIRYCRLNLKEKRNKLQIGKFDLQLTSNEHTFLKLDETWISMRLDDCQSKIAYRSIAELTSYICYEDKQNTELIIKVIENGVHHKNCGFFKPYLRTFQLLLEIEDSL